MNAQPNSITFFSAPSNTWVVRITADRRIEVNEGVDVTEAAKNVLDAMQHMLTPKRPWVPLTDEEKDSLLLPFGCYWVIDAIEAKLKEKNGV